MRTLLIAAGAAVIGAAIFVYAGIYNIAATVQHTAPVYWLLEIAMRRSVQERAQEIEVPPLGERPLIERGFVARQQTREPILQRIPHDAEPRTGPARKWRRAFDHRFAAQLAIVRPAEMLRIKRVAENEYTEEVFGNFSFVPMLGNTVR